MSGISSHWGHIKQSRLLLEKVGDLLRSKELRNFDIEHYHNGNINIPSTDTYLALQPQGNDHILHQLGEVKAGDNEISRDTIIKSLCNFYKIYEELPPLKKWGTNEYEFVIYASFPEIRHLAALDLIKFTSSNSAFENIPNKIRQKLVAEITSKDSQINAKQLKDMLKITKYENAFLLPVKRYDNFSAILGNHELGKKKYQELFEAIANYIENRKETQCAGNVQQGMLDQYLQDKGLLRHETKDNEFEDWYSKYSLNVAPSPSPSNSLGII